MSSFLTSLALQCHHYSMFFNMSNLYFLLKLCLFLCLWQNSEGSIGYRDVGDIVSVEGDESVNQYFDLVFADLRLKMIANDVDPITLPSDSDTFTASLFNSVWDGYIWLGGGELGGFSSIHRTGNMSLQFDNSTKEMIVAGDAGLTDLKGKYFTKFNLGPFKSDFGITFKVSFVSLDIKAGVFVFPSHIVLENCTIAELSTLQLKLHGAGLFDTRIYNMLINTLTQVLEPVLTAKISATVCNLLEQAINGGYSTEPPPIM